MKAFCTGCGSALNPDIAFCTGCGTAAQPSTEPTRKNRKWPWILALILLFALGFWLGRLMAPKCPPCPAPPTAGAGGRAGVAGGGGGGRGSPGDGASEHGHGGAGQVDGTARLHGDGGSAEGSGGPGSAGSGTGDGDMTGGGKASVNGDVSAHGGKAKPEVGANGSDDNGGGTGGKGNPGDSPNGPDSDPDAKKRTEAGVWRLAAGAPLSANSVDVPQTNGKDTSVKVLSAPDFRYDKTGLPRYPDANTAVSSAMSYDVEGRTDQYHSSSGILTNGSFDDVVSWYRKNLPPGWSNSTISDLNRLGAVAQQLSPDKIMQMMAAQSDATAVKSAAETPATATTDRTRLSLFAPPAGTKGELGVMIVQKGDQPVEIMMKTHASP
jgi:hypothetical protein